MELIIIGVLVIIAFGFGILAMVFYGVNKTTHAVVKQLNAKYNNQYKTINHEIMKLEQLNNELDTKYKQIKQLAMGIDKSKAEIMQIIADNGHIKVKG